MSSPEPPGADLLKVTMVVSHLTPEYGLERVAKQVAKFLAPNFNLEVVAISGELPSNVIGLPARKVRSLGPSLKGSRRLIAISRIWRAGLGKDDRVVVLAGLWASIPWLLANLFRRGASRVIVWEHSLMRERMQASRRFRWIARLAILLYRRADLIISVSPPVFEDLSKLLPGKRILTIPNPFDDTSTEHRSYKDDGRLNPVRLIMVGSLTKIKRHALALDVLSSLQGATLTIIGDGPELGNLKKKASTVGLLERVSFLGYQSEERVLEELAAHDVFLHTSATETFGLVFLEAASAGLPVVAASNRTSDYMIPRFVPGLTSPGGVDSLAAAINRVAAVVGAQPQAEAASRRLDELGSETVRLKWLRCIDEVTRPSS